MEPGEAQSLFWHAAAHCNVVLYRREEGCRPLKPLILLSEFTFQLGSVRACEPHHETKITYPGLGKAHTLSTANFLSAANGNKVAAHGNEMGEPYRRESAHTTRWQQPPSPSHGSPKRLHFRHHLRTQ